MGYETKEVEQIMSDYWKDLYVESEKEKLILWRVIYALTFIIGILVGIFLL